MTKFTARNSTIAKLRLAIKKERAQILEEMLLDVSRFISLRYKNRIEQNGNQFAHLKFTRHYGNILKLPQVSYQKLI